MKSLNMKLLLSALGIVAMLTNPAFAKKPYGQLSQQQMTSDPTPRSGRGIYDMVSTPNDPTSTYDPADTGGGSFGYNQSLHDDKW
jgi:hypothetical protein